MYTDTENVANSLSVVPVSFIISDMPGEGIVAEKLLSSVFYTVSPVNQRNTRNDETKAFANAKLTLKNSIN